MSEPGAVAGVVPQSSTQGLASIAVFPSSSISHAGADTLAVNPTDGGVGFSNDGKVVSKEGTGATGENDELDDEIAGEKGKDEEVQFTTNYLGESPFYTYNTKPLSTGSAKPDEKFYKDRMLGRGMNKTEIRNGYYYGKEESSIFTWDLSAAEPNITMDTIDKDDLEQIRDV